jgi:hypothetical protein
MLRQELGLNKTFDEVAIGLQKSFSQKFGIGIFKDNVKTDEEIEAKIVHKHKYCSYEWNYKR